jgi:hypothetical protein
MRTLTTPSKDTLVVRHIAEITRISNNQNGTASFTIKMITGKEHYCHLDTPEEAQKHRGIILDVIMGEDENR